MKRILREAWGYAFDASLTPVAEVEPGERVWVETQDAHRGTITDDSVVYTSLEDTLSRLGGANPVAGPIAVRGLSAGDCLLITIEEIVAAPRRGFGYTCTTARVDDRLTPSTVICPLDGDDVVLPLSGGSVRLPARPMLGTIGVAPAGPPRPSFQQGIDILGNVDIPQLGLGATVVVRAQVAGGLLFVGDAHLVQGDAEIHRAAIETEADVCLRFDVEQADRAGFGELPQLNTTQQLGSIAPGPGSLDDLVRLAYRDLAQRLERYHGLTLAEAYRLLGAVGRVTVAQLVPPLSCVVASIDRRYVPR